MKKSGNNSDMVCLNCGTPLDGSTYIDFLSEKEVCAACNKPV